MTQPQTHLQNFTEATASFVIVSIIRPIVEWSAENPEAAITEEALMALLKLPTPVVSAPSTPQRSVTTQSLVPTGVKKARRTGTTTERPRCKWIFTKGDNSGNQCTGYAIENLEYCSACKNKKGAGGSGRKIPSTGTPAPKTTSSRIPKTGLTAKQETKETPEEENYEITVDPFGRTTDDKELLIDPPSGYVLKDTNGSFTIVGYSDNPDSKTMRPLTKAEKEKASKKLGIPTEDGVKMK